MSERVLVYGVAVAGMASLRALVKRGYDVIAADDRVDDAKRKAVSKLGVELIESPDESRIRGLVAAADIVAPAPGIPEGHPLITQSFNQRRVVMTELDLAYEWESNREGGARPMIAVTGTDGKTTTVNMVEAMLAEAGRRTVACGNTEIPLVDALEHDVDSFVVEATSFRLAFVETFRAEASAWLNLAPDHLDWHASMQTYEAAKARIWRNVRPNDVAVGPSSDEIVNRHLSNLRCRRVFIGGSDYHVDRGMLRSRGDDIIAAADMRRSLPHDVTNALTASALCIESGLAPVDAVGRALHTFEAPHHRIEFVAESGGVRWFDDSKATTPHAALTAIRGFDDVVLIAGGRNKDLDLAPMASEAGRVKAVIAIGESADLIAAAFNDATSGSMPVTIAGNMADAVAAAAKAARKGDVVLLSPGCTSFDWYDGYAQRGDHFASCVRDHIGASPRRTGARR